MMAMMNQATKPNRKNRQIKIKPYVSRRVEIEYIKALMQISQACQAEIKAEIVPLIRQKTVADSAEIQIADGLLDSLIHALQRAKVKLTAMIDHIALSLAIKIVQKQKALSDEHLSTQLLKQFQIDFSAWLRDGDLKDVLDEAIASNVKLIKSIPEQYLSKVEDILYNGFQAGQRAEAIQKQLLKLGQSTDSRAKLIAIDQLGKINARITQVRQTNMGITHYTWSTSQDERVRHIHQEREGKVFAWNNPPADGHPGMPIRCRCVAIPYTEHWFDENAKSPEEVMREQERDTSYVILQKQSQALLMKNSSGVQINDLLNRNNTSKQGNPALRLSQALYEMLYEKYHKVPPVWAVNYYTIHSKHINDFLRGNKVNDEFLYPSKTATELLDKLFANKESSVLHPFSVWRGQAMQLSIVQAIQMNLSNGKRIEYKDLAFRSTTLDKDLAKVFSDRHLDDNRVPVLFKLNIKQGMKAIDISEYHFYTGDNEILLNRGSVMDIKKVTKRSDGIFEIEADVESIQPSNNVGDSHSKPRVIEVTDDYDYDKDPSVSRWSSGGTIILY